MAWDAFSLRQTLSRRAPSCGRLRLKLHGALHDAALPALAGSLVLTPARQPKTAQPSPRIAKPRASAPFVSERPYWHRLL